MPTRGTLALPRTPRLGLAILSTSLGAPTSNSTDPSTWPVRETGSGREHAAPLWGPLYLGASGRCLGLLRPQQCPHLANLPVDAGACGATQGCVLLHAVPIVPHAAHIT